MIIPHDTLLFLNRRVSHETRRIQFVHKAPLLM